MMYTSPPPETGSGQFDWCLVHNDVYNMAQLGTRSVKCVLSVSGLMGNFQTKVAPKVV